MRLVEKHALERLLKPLLRIRLRELVTCANLRAALATTAHTVARTLKHDEEVHAKDTRARVVLDSQVDVLCHIFVGGEWSV